MKPLFMILLVLVAATCVQAADPMKVDRVDAIADAPGRVEIAGSLDTSYPTWHRWRGVDYLQVSPDCNLDMTFEYTSDPYFDVFCVQVANTDPIEIWTAPVDGQFDTVLYLYCDPFDPANSTVNCVTVDDDNGDGLLSHIGAVTTVQLTPGEMYWLVICGYSPSSVGNYLIQTSDNVDLCGVPTDATDWGTIKSLFK